MESTLKNQSDSPIKFNLMDPGSISKRKKDKENKNSLSDPLSYSFTDEDDFVIVTVNVGAGNDNRNVIVDVDDQHLSVKIREGRSIQFKLFQQPVPDCTRVNFKPGKCIIELMKKNTEITWKSIEASRDPSVEREMENGHSSLEEDGAFLVHNPHIDLIEVKGDTNMSVYLYVKNMKKDTFKVEFSPSMFVVKFSTSDKSFLENYPSADENSLFEWRVKTKSEIVPEYCHSKVMLLNAEFKLRKKVPLMWNQLRPIMQNSASGTSDVVKNTWVPVKVKQTNLQSQMEEEIPPPPPAPPTFKEAKKPTYLVPPASKAGSSGMSFQLGGIESGGAVCAKGMTGLDNIGNTCFMNSVLQCLANTRELRDYFLNSNLQNELNKDNPLGMGGKLAISFAVLMKFLWTGSVRSYAPSKLKSVMSLKANQFSGFAQHDAQEFMVELLDGLHEDLNRIKKKPYIAEPPDLDGWSDKDAAEESWRLHKMRNDSIIDDLFKGQFKSTLRCHECNKISVKFDEFGCLSVPIPKDQKSIQVIFFWRNPSKRPKKFIVRVSADAMVVELKQQLSLVTGIKSNAVQVLETINSRIHKIFTNHQNLSSIVASDVLMAFEVLTEEQANEPVFEVAVTQRMLIPNPPLKCGHCGRAPAQGNKLKRCTKCYRVAYCDLNCQKNHWGNHKNYCRMTPELVGAPFIISLPASQSTHANLSKLTEGYARYSVYIFQPPITAAGENVRNSRRRKGSTSSDDMSDETEEMEVDGEESGSFDKNNGSYSGEDRAEADWLRSPADAVGYSGDYKSARANRSSSIGSNGSGGDDLPMLSSSPTVKNSANPQKSPPFTRLFSLRPINNKAANIPSPLGDSLEDKDSEPLDLKNVQYLAMDWCTNQRFPIHCFVQNKDIDCEVVQENSSPISRHTTLDACIDLFTQPENLSESDSWKCPRCKKPVEATKQMSIWRLPNILIVQLKRFSFKFVLYSDKIDKFVQYPIKNLDVSKYMSSGATDSPTTYDLYGVINHMGRLLGGHYTSYCRTVDQDNTSQSEIDWRLCDDSRVNHAQESRVVHDQAYLLLYRRRDCPFTVPRPLPSTNEESGDEEEQELNNEVEPMETPMSISSASQISSESEVTGTLQEELD